MIEIDLQIINRYWIRFLKNSLQKNNLITRHDFFIWRDSTVAHSDARSSLQKIVLNVKKSVSIFFKIYFNWHVYVCIPFYEWSPRTSSQGRHLLRGAHENSAASRMHQIKCESRILILGISQQGSPIWCLLTNQCSIADLTHFYHWSPGEGSNSAISRLFIDTILFCQVIVICMCDENMWVILFKVFRFMAQQYPKNWDLKLQRLQVIRVYNRKAEQRDLYRENFSTHSCYCNSKPPTSIMPAHVIPVVINISF